jgi:uncharacterized cupredoxin-like copper-binding protein
MQRQLFVLALAFAASYAMAQDEAPHKPAADHQHEHTMPGHDQGAGKDTAFGRPGDPAHVDRTIRVEMRDPVEFAPSQIDVRTGETIRFFVVNTGKHQHEMVLGTMQQLEEHNEEMKQHPHGMQHGAPHMVEVPPGKSALIVWQFTKPGEFWYACLVEDHFDLGMYGKIRVAGAPQSSATDEHLHAQQGAHSAHQHSTGGGQHHATMEMRGAYGPYSMSRESSGTSWQPDASPHAGIERQYGEWMTMTHGFVNLIYDHQGGPRGDGKAFSTSMLMLMAQRPAGDGTLGVRAMVSADALMGKRGYPLLLQTGESANGQPLIDRQHPHDLFMELAASYSHRLGERGSAFIYAGLPGEPALGPPAFMHRFSGEDNPEAPISHHWLDSTHITYGVMTLGYIYGRFKLEGSVFRGREPDESRWNIESGKLDSASMRLSFNPTASWALQVSRGRIKSPEELHPDVDLDRTTWSAIYQRPFASAEMQTTLAWGRNAPTHGAATSAWLAEAALRVAHQHTVFARGERTDKNELFSEADARAAENFRVAKLTVGYVYDLARESRTRIGIGGLVSRYSIPAELAGVYGNPTSFMLFARVRI